MERPNWEEKDRPVEEIKKATEGEDFETGTSKEENTEMERPAGGSDH